jgi:surface polysaccharide O-acyltransferase-like enzyme
MKAVVNMDQKPRLNYFDNLRWLMIVFVVIMHANVTYGMLGDWYYVEEAQLDIFQNIYFAVYGSFTQAYFMGLLFFIAGYFVPHSFDRKGFWIFIKERGIRLGIPSLLYMLLLHPLNIIILNHYQHWNMDIPAWYLKNIITFSFIDDTGPLWFAVALLIFSLFYALIRLTGIGSARTLNEDAAIRSKQVIIIALILSMFTFTTRLLFPIGSNVLNMQLCFFPQYILLFILGIIISRHNLLQTLSYRTGITWFKYTLLFGTIFWFLMVFIGEIPSKGFDAFTGHFTWQSAAYSFWESFFCVGICLGLIVLFRKKFNQQGRQSKFLSANAFGVYVFHAPVLIFISMLFKNITMYPFFKYLVVAVITIPLCFLVSYLLRKIPGAGYIIK